MIRSIEQVAARLVACRTVGVIFNRTRPGFDPDKLSDIPPVLAAIGDDASQAECDMEGNSVFCLPDESAILQGADQALETLLRRLQNETV